MSNYANLKSAIQSVIKTNGNNEITGQLLQNELLAMITTLGYGYQFIGVASPETVPGTPDAKVFYIAYTPGTYTNFGGIAVTGLCVLKYVSSWTKEDIPISGGGADFVTEPDDLTLVSGTPNKLKFADRSYNSENPNGMGYKILRKDASFASQVTEANTIYDIRYNFNLGGQSITIPTGVILKFKGGKLSNGGIVGQMTKIDADPVRIFDGVTASGRFTNNFAQLNWWCIPSEENGSDVDATQDLSIAFSSDFRGLMLNGVYAISSPVLLPSASIVTSPGHPSYGRYGFRAISGFAGKTISDPRVSGNTLSVSGMFYHYYDYAPKLINIFIDAKHNAKFCIEHLAGYSWCDLVNCRLKNALFACVLQYACEQPMWEKTKFEGSHIGLLVTSRTLDAGDIWIPDGVFKGSPNLIQVTQCMFEGCNCGAVFSNCSNVALYSCKFGYNSILGAYFNNCSVQISDIYSEGDGQCHFWYNPDTGEKLTASTGQVVSYLTEASHTIGGVSTPGRLDGFASVYDAKFTTGITGDKTYYRGAFFFAGSNVNIDSAYMSYINRGGNVEVLDPSPDDVTYSGVDALFLSIVSTLNLSNIKQYNRDHTGNDSLFALIVDLVSSNVSQTASKIQYVRGRNTMNRIYLTAPINGFPDYAVLVDSDKYSWGYNGVGMSFPDYNANIESRLRGAGYDANHYKYNYKGNIFSGMYRNVPLYKQILKSQNLPGYYIPKSEIANLFPGREQILVIFYAKLLTDVASGLIRLTTSYNSNYWTSLYQRIDSITVSNGKAGQVFRMKQVVFLTPPASENIGSTWNYLYIRNFSDIADENIAISDLLMYDLEDGSELAPQYESFYLQSGTTARRPSATDVPAGTQYFDTTLGKMLVSNGTDWVNMDGTPLTA